MTCPYCGKRILDKEAPYCPYCRKELGPTPIEKPKLEQKNYWICQSCKQINSPEAGNCKSCGRPISFIGSLETDRISQTYYDNPSWAWYLVPLFFGILGGLIGYVGTKDRDSEMADKLLIFSVIWTFVLGAIYWYFLSVWYFS